MKHFNKRIQGWFSFPGLYREAVRLAPDDGTLVEIGSWRGKSLAFLVVESLNSGKSHRIVAVDPWSDGLTGDGGEDVMTADEVFEDFRANLSPIEDRYEYIRSTSLEAAGQFEDGSLDFVFVDGSHAYRDVLDDLEAWYPKVSAGGTLAGHDYHWPEVRRAVREFGKATGLRVPLPVELCWVIRIHPDPRNRRDRLRALARVPFDFGVYAAAWLRLMVLRAVGRRPKGDEFYRS
jgi:hypothetical protein